MRYLWLLALMGCGGVTLVRFGKPHPAVHCGVERWAVKTLVDPGAAQVHFSAIPTTIHFLRNLPAPKVLPTTRLTAERQTYTVSAVIQAWKLEADGDYHLALSDHGETMIAEVPNPACMGKSRVAPQVRIARQAVLTALGKPSSMRFLTVNRTATITGVFFLDVLHGQRNVAPNGAELHPIVRITFP